MEILIIVLGTVFGVGTIFGLVVALTGVFKLKKEIKSLENHTLHLQQQSESNLTDIHRRIDADNKEIERAISNQIAILNKSIDSRIDKLEHRVTAKIPPTNADVLAELLQVREEFLTLRKNL